MEYDNKTKVQNAITFQICFNGRSDIN